jgi:hypothetical protein
MRQVLVKVMGSETLEIPNILICRFLFGKESGGKKTLSAIATHGKV